MKLSRKAVACKRTTCKTSREFDKALDEGNRCTGFQFVKKQMIRHIGTKEHGCVKVKVFCISSTVLEFVSALAIGFGVK